MNYNSNANANKQYLPKLNSNGSTENLLGPDVQQYLSQQNAQTIDYDNNKLRHDKNLSVNMSNRYSMNMPGMIAPKKNFKPVNLQNNNIYQSSLQAQQNYK